MSGTIRKSEEEAIRRAREDILRARGKGVDTLARLLGSGQGNKEGGSGTRGIEDSDDGENKEEDSQDGGGDI